MSGVGPVVGLIPTGEEEEDEDEEEGLILNTHTHGHTVLSPVHIALGWWFSNTWRAQRPPPRWTLRFDRHVNTDRKRIDRSID